MVDHAESAPPEFRSAIAGFLGLPLGSIERRPSETLPGLACLAHPWSRAGRAWRRYGFPAFLPAGRCRGHPARHFGAEPKGSKVPWAVGATADQLAGHGHRGWCGDGSRELDSLRWGDGARLACGRAWNSGRRAADRHAALVAE